MTAMYPDSNRCASAFIFSMYYFRSVYPLPTGISIKTTHVPAVLNWDPTYCGGAGCDNLVTVFGNKTDNLIGGCLQPSCKINDETSSIDGCIVNIPQGLSSFYVNMSRKPDSSDYRMKRSCEFASMISYDYDLTFNVSNTTHVPTQLQWGTPIVGECYLNDSSDTSCISDGKYCWSRLSFNHLCVCYRDIYIGYSTLCTGMN
ncbi:hypothetical protein Gotur_009389 [Gossypium turneri]